MKKRREQEQLVFADEQDNGEYYIFRAVKSELGYEIE